MLDDDGTHAIPPSHFEMPRAADAPPSTEGRFVRPNGLRVAKHHQRPLDTTYPSHGLVPATLLLSISNLGTPGHGRLGVSTVVYSNLPSASSGFRPHKQTVTGFPPWASLLLPLGFRGVQGTQVCAHGDSLPFQAGRSYAVRRLGYPGSPTLAEGHVLVDGETRQSCQPKTRPGFVGQSHGPHARPRVS